MDSDTEMALKIAHAIDKASRHVLYICATRPHLLNIATERLNLFMTSLRRELRGEGVDKNLAVKLCQKYLWQDAGVAKPTGDTLMARWKNTAPDIGQLTSVAVMAKVLQSDDEQLLSDTRQLIESVRQDFRLMDLMGKEAERLDREETIVWSNIEALYS